MNEYNQVAALLPRELSETFMKISNDHLENIEEIRLRVMKPVMLQCSKSEFFLSKITGLSLKPDKHSIIANQKLLDETIKIMCSYSYYAIEDDLRQGYFTLTGGHRVGVCGNVVNDGNKIRTLKNISSINIRIAKEIIGSAEEVIKRAYRDRVRNTIVISPPGCGKTTMLRDIIRVLSNGTEELSKGYKVGLVDERSEIAGCHMGIPQKDIGIRTDVLDGCPKIQGINMLLRSMAPEIIAVDEIGDVNEVEVIRNAMYSGVKILATAHGENLNEVRNKSGIKDLINNCDFERIVILSKRKGPGTIEEIINL